MASGFSTLQEIVANQSKQENPFASLQQGMQTGASIGGQLMQKQLEQQRLGIDIQYKKQELDRQLASTRLTSLKDIASTDDPVASKLLADAHMDNAKKYGWNDGPMVEMLQKSRDAKQSAIAGFGGLDLGDPKVLSQAQQKLNATGGSPKANIDLLNDMAKIPAQRDQAKLLAQTKFDVANNKEQGSIVNRVMGAASPEDAAILSDPDRLHSDEGVAALGRASANYAKGQQSTQALKTQTQQATLNAKQGADQDKVFNPIETNLKKEMDSSRRLHHTDNLLKPGMSWPEFQLTMDDMIYGIKNSSRITQQEQKSLGMSSIQKYRDQAQQAVTNKFEGGPSDALVQQMAGIRDKTLNAVESGTAKEYANFANSRIKAGRTDEDTAKNRFEGMFPGRKWEDYSYRNQGGQSSGGQQPAKPGMYNMGNGQYTEDQLRQFAKTSKNPNAAQQFKQATGKDL